MVREGRAKYKKTTFISHPRSGLTWFRWMLHEFRKIQHPEELKPPPKHKEERNPLIAYDHDCIGLMSSPRYFKKHPRSKGINKWNGYKVIFLLRHPLDVILSNYYFLVVRGKNLSIGKKVFGKHTLESFFKCKTFGVISLVNWILWWEEKRAECEDFLYLNYEDTLIDPGNSLERVLNFVGADFNKETIDQVVKLSSFDVMKNHEQEHGGLFTDQAGIIGKDRDTAVVRKGRSGQWKNELPDDLQEWCFKAIQPLSKTFARSYLK